MSGPRASAIRLTAVIGSLEAGGAERMMTLLAGAWVERGWEVTLLTLAGPDREVFFRVDDRIRLRHLDLYGPSRGIGAALASNLRRLRVLRRAVRASRPDLVLSFTTETNVLTILAALGTGSPVVVEEHTDPSVQALRRPWPLLRRLTYLLASSVVALSPSALAALGPARGRRGRVIPNPVLEPPPAATVPTDPPTLVSLGRLVTDKGCDLLLAAFASVAPDFPGWRLEIWGEGPERERLEAQRDALGLADRVALPGLTHEPYAVLRRAWVFVMPSRREGFPTALGEAMACGIPVVAFDCPSGPRQLIRDGVDGLLVPAEDVAALADALRRLMADRELAGRLASRAPEVVRRFALSAVLERWDAVFSEVLGRPVGTAREVQEAEEAHP